MLKCNGKIIEIELEKELLGETLDEHYPGPECPECGERERLDIHKAEYEDGFLLHPAHVDCLNPDCGAQF